MFSIVWHPDAEKELGKLEHLTALRILKKILGLKEGLNSDIKRLKGSAEYRLRIGDYRVIFSVEHDKITVLKVGHRKNIYDR